MAIQVHCPGCDQLLQVPDDASGKKAKCPKCQQVIPIPESTDEQTSSDYQTPDHEQLPDSQSPFAVQQPQSADDSVNPFQSPSTVSDSYQQSFSSDESDRKGPPWEQFNKSFATFWQTTKGVLFSPAELFLNMRRTGGLGNPILFMIIGGVIGGAVGGLFNGILQGAMFSFMGNGPNVAPFGRPAMIGIQVASGIMGGIMGGTIGNLIVSFVSAGIMHLMLMLFKGANRDFETTYRVVAYTIGATAMLNVIPFLGAYAGGIWALVAYIIGLAKAHDTTMGKSAAAVLVPTLACCVLVAGLIGAFVGTAFMGGFPTP